MNPIEFPRDEVTERLYKIYAPSNRELLYSIQEVISPNAAALADHFYNNLLTISESLPYLNHEVVSERLHRSMAEWIRSLFQPADEHSISEHMKGQRIVGDVHARVNVPMRLVNHGIRLLKQEMGNLLRESDLEDARKYTGLVLVNDLLDFSSSLINESYITNRMSNERDAQALRMHVMSFSLVVELERLRSSLFDWLRRTITDIYGKYPDNKPSISSIYTSDFGLWATYKAELLLSDRPELFHKLKLQLDAIEETISKINQLEGQDARAAMMKAIDLLNEGISNAAWLLGEFSSQAYEMETGRDPLTRLFNRRFLPSVMQNLIRVSKTTSSTFTIISCDMDNFKPVNDIYGHEAGDQLLAQFGELLAAATRVTDYVFRMGGDEFLIVLAGADSQVAVGFADKLVERLADHEFKLMEGTGLKMNMSIGIAEYDGHPDYLRLTKNADQALYEAKKLGKNRYFVKSGR